jgi:hypothetical protein
MILELKWCESNVERGNGGVKRCQLRRVART